MIVAPDHGSAGPVRGSEKVESMSYTPQTPSNPRVQSGSPFLHLDFDEEDDAVSMDILFSTAPQQELGTTRNQVKRRTQEVSGGDDSPRGTPPSGGTERFPSVPQIVELNRELRALAELMQQVVTNNESKYQDVMGALRKVASVLRESREEPRETRSDPKARAKSTVPLELKVKFLWCLIRLYAQIIVQREVRKHSLILLGREKNKSPVPPPPDPVTIQKFNETGKGGPKGRPGELRLDLEGPVRSPWNLCATRCFRKHFRRSGLYPEWSKSDIETAFLRHTETIRSHYQRDKGEITSFDLAERSYRAAKRNRLNTVRVQPQLVLYHLTSMLCSWLNTAALCVYRTKTWEDSGSMSTFLQRAEE